MRSSASSASIAPGSSGTQAPGSNAFRARFSWALGFSPYPTRPVSPTSPASSRAIRPARISALSASPSASSSSRARGWSGALSQASTSARHSSSVPLALSRPDSLEKSGSLSSVTGGQTSEAHSRLKSSDSVVLSSAALPVRVSGAGGARSAISAKRRTSPSQRASSPPETRAWAGQSGYRAVKSRFSSPTRASAAMASARSTLPVSLT